MTTLPSTERLLLGPGPSPVPPRVMRAMMAPVLGHLDPALLDLMDDLRASLAGVFRAPERSLALAVSGTGTSGMEAAVTNLVAPGTRVVSVVNGYFGARLAEMATRYGGEVRRVEGEWGPAIDPATARPGLNNGAGDLVRAVPPETLTRVPNPGHENAAGGPGPRALVR